MAVDQSNAVCTTSQHRFEPKHCKKCGGAMPDSLSPLAVYCSAACKRQARRESDKLAWDLRVKNSDHIQCAKCGEKKHAIDFRPGMTCCIDCERSDARERMRAKMQDPAFRVEKQKWKKRNPESVERYQRKSRTKSGDIKYHAHVRDWRRYLRSLPRHDAHVSEWKRRSRGNRLLGSAGWWARKAKSEGKPWRNPHFSIAMRYKIRYRMDLEFRLGEINRQTWRKETLKAREDGTVNFWVLLRERKTCPYCGTKITKENAVGDHMIPIKLGGANSNHNMTICCKDCNKAKAAKPYDLWVRMLPEDRRRAAVRWFKRKHGYDPMARQSGLAFEFM